MHRLAIVCLAAWLASCATAEGPTGPKFTEHALRAGAVAPEMARLYVFWPAPDSQRGGAAKLTIDGNGVGECEQGGFNTYDVPAGAHVLSTVNENLPGRCDVRVDALSGSTYFYEISPRSEYGYAAMPGSVLASIPFPPITLIGIAIAVGGMALESSGKECGGPFSLAPIEESAALPKISGLKKSK